MQSSAVDVPTKTNATSVEKHQTIATSSPRPRYIRRLIPMIQIPADEIDENFDAAAWREKVYGPEIIIVHMVGVPKG